MEKLLKITVPDTLSFAQLQLAREANGSVTYSLAVVEQLCRANGIDAALSLDWSEDNIAGLIVAWYGRHRELGGAPDPVADDLIAETIAEDALGDGLSHPPGRA